jgi:hypothetical protein
MAQLYADEGFPKPVVEELRKLGHDVLSCQGAGKAGQKIPDSDVLTFAISLKRAVVTRNRRHFIRLHSQSPIHAGIIVCTEDDDFLRQAARIHKALSPYASIDNQLIRIYRPNQP